MSSPIDFVEKKQHYNIIHRIQRTDTDTLVFTLSPTSFPFDGLCRLQVNGIHIVGTAAATININTNIPQPYSQSNYSTGTGNLIYNNPNRTLATITVPNGRLSFYPPNQYIETQLFSGQRITFTITDATASAYTPDTTNWDHIILDLSIKAIN